MGNVPDDSTTNHEWGHNHIQKYGKESQICWEELTEKTMSHFGVKKISNFGKKIFVCLILLVAYCLTSCEGTLYSIQYSKEELQNDLCSLEIVSDIEIEEGILSYSTVKEITDADEKEDIINTLSDVTFQGLIGPPKIGSTVGIAFVYSDRKLIFEEYAITTTDSDGHIIGKRKKDNHWLYTKDREFQSVIQKYIEPTTELGESSE